MAFTYVPDTDGRSELDKMELRHRYFARVRPNGSGLVPGLLVQGKRPKEGKWVDVADFSQEFSERYFVRYTDFHTLVPGSLMKADRAPKGKWKEVKKREEVPPINSPVPFYRIQFSSPEYSIGGGPDPVVVVSGQDFYDDILLPAIGMLESAGVSVPPVGSDTAFYYFKGDFAELNREANKLRLFGSMGEYDPPYASFHIKTSEGAVTYNMSSAQAPSRDIEMRMDTATGLYSFAVAPLVGGNPGAYIVLEHIVLRESVEDEL